MGRKSCGHLCWKPLHTQCRYTKQCSNWRWDQQMSKIQWYPQQLLLSTSCNQNHLCVWQGHCPIFELFYKETCWHLRWWQGEGATLAPPAPVHGHRETWQHISLSCVEVWSGFSHPQCIKQCSCPPLASVQWIPVAFQLFAYSVSFIVFCMLLCFLLTLCLCAVLFCSPFLARWCLFCWQYSAGNRLAGAIVPTVEDSVSWHDVIQRKRLLCQENAVLLVVQRLGVTAAIPMIFSSTLALTTYDFFLCFFQALLTCYV